MIGQHGEQLQKLFVNVFLFIDKVKIENFISLSLSQTNYFILMIGVGIVILFLTGFMLGMIFKFITIF